MHNPIYDLENETYKIFWVFEMKIDHPVPARTQEKNNNTRTKRKEFVI